MTISKRKIIMSINKNVEKLELSYTVGGAHDGAATWANNWAAS